MATPMQFPTLLRNGIIAGAAAGTGAALMLWFLVEPVIGRALVVEESRGGGHHHGDEDEPLVSRTDQVVAGGITEVIVAIMFGIVFAVVFAKVRHRLPGSTDFGRALVLAGTGFAVFVLMPALTIPSNPPAVGDPDTVNERTLVYALTILLSLLVVGALMAANRALRDRDVSLPARCTADLLVTVLLAGAVLLLAPDSPDAIPHDVPADLIWDFRIASLGHLGAMWLLLGLVFGARGHSRAPDARSLEPAAV